MEQRTRQRLRRLIELSVEAVGRGVMPMSKAAEVMESAGVRFEVVCRVLMPLKNGTRAPADANRATQPVPNHWDDIAAR